ncbi:hypothetical protein L7F22_027883 [Adiantum nelumboides]|nr:hypothetical protein [Adiantum nelumboides]
MQQCRCSSSSSSDSSLESSEEERRSKKRSKRHRHGKGKKKTRKSRSRQEDDSSTEDSSTDSSDSEDGYFYANKKNFYKANQYDFLEDKSKKVREFKEGGQSIKFETFSGYKDASKALSFIQQFDIAFAGGRYSEHSKIRRVASYFKGNARTVRITQCRDAYSKRRCGPCKIMYPKIVELSQKHADVVFLKLDCNQENKALAKQLGVKVVPTFKLFRNRQVIAEVKGAKFDELVQSIDEARTS